MWIPKSNRVRIPGLQDDDSSSDSDYEEQDEQLPLQIQDDDHEQPPLQHQDDEQPPLQHQGEQVDDHEQATLQNQDQPHEQDRNALSVLENPTRNEVDEDNDLRSSSGSVICETDSDFSSSSEFHKNSKPRAQPAMQLVPSASDAQSVIHVHQPKVNLAVLSTESLSRYCKYYKIAGITSDSSREQMLNAVQQHYVTQPPLDDMQVLEDFISASKRLK